MSEGHPMAIFNAARSRLHFLRSLTAAMLHTAARSSSASRPTPRINSAGLLNGIRTLSCYMSLLQEIVEKGDGIYRAKYKRDCEQRYFGRYIAIDVETGDGFIAASAAAAIRSGQSAGKPGALFRLIRIGYKTGGNPASL